MIDGPLWSLAVEEQFYLFWPLAILLLNKRNLYLVALLLVAVAPVSRALEYLSGSRLYPLLTSNIDALMIGGLLSLICRDRPDFIKTLSARIPTVGRIAAVALMYLPVALSYRVLLGPLTVTLGPMIQAACAGYLIASFLFVRQGLGFALLNSKALSVLGLLSYGLYVWQMPFLMPPETYGDTSSPAWLAFPTNLALIFTVSVASLFVLERPLVNLRKRLRPVG